MNIVAVPGWEDRRSSDYGFEPIGYRNHHTARREIADWRGAFEELAGEEDVPPMDACDTIVRAELKNRRSMPDTGVVLLDGEGGDRRARGRRRAHL